MATVPSVLSYFNILHSLHLNLLQHLSDELEPLECDPAGPTSLPVLARGCNVWSVHILLVTTKLSWHIMFAQHTSISRPTHSFTQISWDTKKSKRCRNLDIMRTMIHDMGACYYHLYLDTAIIYHLSCACNATFHTPVA